MHNSVIKTKKTYTEFRNRQEEAPKDVRELVKKGFLQGKMNQKVKTALDIPTVSFRIWISLGDVGNIGMGQGAAGGEQARSYRSKGAPRSLWALTLQAVRSPLRKLFDQTCTLS